MQILRPGYNYKMGANTYIMEENALIPMEDEYVEKMFLGQIENPIAASGLSLTQAERIIDQMVEYKKMRMMYTCALKEIRTKFDVLNTEFGVRYQRNPIEFITMRVKSTHSIFEKMRRQNQMFTMTSLEENISDIAGIRVICSYVDDIYMLAQALLAQDDITLLREKDYISHPKDNGYRSLHLIVSVPVFFTDRKKDMKVEVQIRTIAMDFWASLEHGIKYKKNVPNQQEIVERLKNCAEVIAETDMTMLDIRREMEDDDIREKREQSGRSSMETLLEKLKRLDTPIV
ncbi:MAG: GTP pyrophosphokinase family protein [Lachnospiraceae bacterium]|nr:GTP pyrophosphokinase family protein [Lachnospiraceae bacterium]